jgi:dipeptidyl aminopeptidase/acylaminoacyl peptidase
LKIGDWKLRAEGIVARTALLLLAWVPFLHGQPHTNVSPPSLDQKLTGLNESLDFVQQRLNKSIADLVWLQRLQDIAVVDKVRYVGPPPRAGQRANTTNGVIISAYTFMPRRGFGAPKLPLIVLLHTEVHGDFNPEDDLRVTRELIEQGYAVVAPDYRGSTGYGGDFWRLIDYGGLENEDVLLARQWMLDHYPKLDGGRVGIMGWSHGGMIALMNIFSHPEAYAAGYAGMPVTDLPFRLAQKAAPYRELFSAPYHIGKTIEEDPEEYRRRSPVTHAAELKRPLLLHAVTNDEDVSQAEVERLVSALRAAKKEFQYKVYTNAPGGHAFNKLDTAEAKASRLEIYRFLAKHLRPPKPSG